MKFDQRCDCHDCRQRAKPEPLPGSAQAVVESIPGETAAIWIAQLYNENTRLKQLLAQCLEKQQRALNVTCRAYANEKLRREALLAVERALDAYGTAGDFRNAPTTGHAAANLIKRLFLFMKVGGVSKHESSVNNANQPSCDGLASERT